MSLTTRVEELLGDRVGRLTHWGGDAVPIASPRDEAELVTLLRTATADGLRVLPIGNGTKLDHALVPERVDLAVSTRRLVGITAYDPAEGVLTARAGTSLRSLRETVEAQAHHLSPEVARGDRATLGGAIGAASIGADRLGHGPLRDRVLGVRVALSDGRIVKSGGALVKDVAGYDLHRLVCGAHGTLGVVVEASLRLASPGELRVLVRRRVASLDEGLALCAQLRADVAAPRALRLDGDASKLWLTLDLAGRRVAVEAAVDAALAHLGEAHALKGDGARRVGDELTEARRERGQWPHLCVDALPSRFEAVVAAVLERGASLGARFELHPALGLGWLRFERAPGRETAHAIDRAVRELGAAPRWCGLAPALRTELVVASGAPAGAAIMRRVRLALDPTETFAGPRLHPDL